MWYTNRFEGYDNPHPDPRQGSTMGKLAQKFESRAKVPLRSGLTQQLVGLLGLVISYYAFGGPLTFTPDLFYSDEDVRSHTGFWIALVIFQGLYLIGCVHLAFYQAILSDDAGSARGFTTGSKCLMMAIILDTIAQSVQLGVYVNFYHNFDAMTWKTIAETTWLAQHLPRAFHGIACFAYAAAFFLLESFHDEGTGGSNAFVVSSLYMLTGFFEFCISPESRCGGAAFWLSVVATFSALLWGLSFEELTNQGAELNETELVNQTEENVNQASMMAPYVNV